MLNVVKETKGDTLILRMNGSIEESVDLGTLFGPPQPKMDLYLKEVSRINSMGVKAWLNYFQAAQAKGSKFRYFECSTAMVEQINMISNFTCGGVVESVFVPFVCENCKAELVGCFRCTDIKKVNCNMPFLKCTKCSGKAVFDDISEEYFAFLRR